MISLSLSHKLCANQKRAQRPYYDMKLRVTLQPSPMASKKFYINRVKDRLRDTN